MKRWKAGLMVALLAGMAGCAPMRQPVAKESVVHTLETAYRQAKDAKESAYRMETASLDAQMDTGNWQREMMWEEGGATYEYIEYAHKDLPEEDAGFTLFRQQENTCLTIRGTRTEDDFLMESFWVEENTQKAGMAVSALEPLLDVQDGSMRGVNPDYTFEQDGTVIRARLADRARAEEEALNREGDDLVAIKIERDEYEIAVDAQGALQRMKHVVARTFEDMDQAWPISQESTITKTGSFLSTAERAALIGLFDELP